LKNPLPDWIIFKLGFLKVFKNLISPDSVSFMNCKRSTRCPCPRALIIVPTAEVVLPLPLPVKMAIIRVFIFVFEVFVYGDRIRDRLDNIALRIASLSERY